MKNYKSTLTSVTMVMLGAAAFAVTVEAGTPSRQTPYLVPKSKQGVVEVGPCQMPPCVGGRAVTPNARDYGYYEGTWRQWPTQQRYDQKFPQALNATPTQKNQGSVSTLPNSVISAPSTATMTAPMPNVNTITVPDDPEPTPSMGNITDSALSVPSNVVVPQTMPITPKNVDPLLDYSTNTVPGISTAPSISTPAVAPSPALAPAPVEEPKTIDAPELDELPEVVPAEEDDAVLTAPAPSLDSPLMDSEEPITQSQEIDDTLSVPVSKQNSSGERSIIVSQNENGMNAQQLPPLPTPNDPYMALVEDKKVAETQNQNVIAQNPYDMAAVQVSHVENSTGTATKVNPFNTAVIPSEVPNTSATDNQTVADAIMKTPEMVDSTEDANVAEDSTENAENASENGVGLEGFCPVTLQESESWTEGDAQWSVIHHGVTYYLASAEQVQKFLANPEKYTPVMDGADPVLLTETGVREIGTVDNCVVFEGKLYMFTSETNLNKFFENTSAYMK